MKKVILSIAAILFVGVTSMFATCKWDSYFKYPKGTQKCHGYVYVKVQPKYGHHDISYVKLYVDGQYVRKENNYPYEWGKNGGSDHRLKNMSPGSHTLKAVIYDKCGQKHFITKTIHVSCNGNGHPPHTDDCHFQNPCVDLHWLKMKKHNYPYLKICEFTKHGKTYFRLYKCNSSSSYYSWYDCHGNFKGKWKGHTGKNWGGTFKKCWYNPCNGGGNNGGGGHCNNAAHYQYPTQNNKTYMIGQKVYVRCAPQNKNDIAYMELYVDGQFVRKESHYPYEWGKSQSSDPVLSNLHAGTHQLKIKVKDKCGKYKYYHRTIHIALP